MMAQLDHPNDQDPASQQILSRVLAGIFWTLLVGLIALSAAALPY